MQDIWAYKSVGVFAADVMGAIASMCASAAGETSWLPCIRKGATLQKTPIYLEAVCKTVFIQLIYERQIARMYVRMYVHSTRWCMLPHSGDDT